ncbi:SLATT domain-containing protein, partial [Streptomyces sp. SID8455]|nr:SLATT domain-containing protein [Streptomyces sp. SID8455]
WRYAVHGSPFETAAPHPEALFANRLEEGLQELRKVGWADPREAMTDGGGTVITESMRALRDRAFTVRKETYVRDRLIEQRRWYRRRRLVSRRGALVWSGAIVALTLPALALSVLQTFGVGRSFGLTGVLSAAGAACLAWNELRRHHPLISAHSLVEDDLESMQAAMETTLTERQWPVAVFETERIVSPEHTDWLVRHRT